MFFGVRPLVAIFGNPGEMILIWYVVTPRRLLSKPQIFACPWWRPLDSDLAKICCLGRSDQGFILLFAEMDLDSVWNEYATWCRHLASVWAEIFHLSRSRSPRGTFVQV
jgi:hypothetical protein